MNKMLVETLLKKLVKPSSPTPDHLRRFELCFLDQIPAPIYIPLLYYYPAGGNVEAAEMATRIENFEKSLSEILCRCYPLAGRLAPDLLSVDCQDQGVQYIVAKVNCQLNEFLGEGCNNVDLLTSLAPKRVIDDLVTAPLACVQISRFECGGLALALNFLHKVFDGFSDATFTAEWAKMSKCGISEVKFPSFDLVSIFPAIDISRKIIPRRPVTPVAEIVAKRLLFDGAAIRDLKDQVMASAPDLDCQPSRVEVVTAFVWSRLIRAAQARHGYLRNSVTSLSVNLRGRTAIGLPQNSFGNIYIPVPIKFRADEGKMELHYFVRLIRNATQKTVSKCRNASKDDLASMIIKAHNEMREWLGNGEVDARFASSLCRFPQYEVDFGWGKPSWVSVLKFSTQMFMLLDTKCGTGVEVFLSLNKIEMQKLECDPCMAAFGISSW